MAVIHEQLTLDDYFSATFTKFLQYGEKAACASQRAAQAASNYQSVLNSLDRSLISTNAQFASMMQEQQRMAAAGQQNTAAFADLDKRMEKLGGTIRDLTAQYDFVERQANEAAQAANKFASANKTAKTSSTDLSRSLKGLLGGYLSFQSVKSVFNLSDQLASSNARLQMMTGSAEAAAAAQDEIYAAAMRSRGAYTDMADTVAKLGTLAGDAFGSTSEIIAFAEQLQKQMAMSGTSTASAQAAMLQLTQGLSSGALRGEELNSVLEQTPMIAQTIADSLGVTTGQMREMASEGALTADVVKNAILGAADETNAAFEQMPYTWGQVWTQIKNITLRMTQPVLNVINQMANKVDEAMQWIKDNSELVAGALAAVATAAAIAGAQMLMSALKSAGAWAMAHLPLLAVAAGVGLIIYMARAAGATWEEIGGVIGGVFGAMYAAAMNNFIVPAQQMFAMFVNFLGNVFNDPVASIKILFLDMASFIIDRIRQVASGIETLINAIPGVEVNITSGLDNLYNKIQGTRDRIKNESGWKEYIKPWEYVDYTDAWNAGSEIGAKLGRGLDNFDLNSFVSGLTSSSYVPTVSSPQLDDIAGSVSSIEKAVDMSQEDLKMLVDESERRYVNRINLTSQTPVITVNGANTGRTAADRQSLANAIRDILIEQTAAGSVISTAVPVVG